MKKIKYLLLLLLLFPFGVLAASKGTIELYASSKSVKVGNSVTVTLYCKSSTPIGTCEYTLDYDTSKLKLTSGSVSDLIFASNDSTKSLKATFTFKVIATGSSKVTVKAYGMREFVSEDNMSVTLDPVTITGVKDTDTSSSTTTKKTYSTNNNLKSLTVDGYTLSPTFNKDTLEYKVELDSSVEKITVNATKEDSSASIKGVGEVKVSEGDNKIEIVVTSEKGTTKTYTIIATVKDNNPIKVTIDNKEYTVVKRESALTKPDNYESTKTTINGEEVPSFYNEANNYTLVGLKDSDGNINLYIYNSENNTYTKYKEITFNNIKFLPLEPNKEFENYKKVTIKIGEEEITGYKLNDDSKYTLIYGRNLETSLTNWYTYEEDENTIQKYTDELDCMYNNKIDDLKNLVLILGGIILILAILIIVVCCIKTKSKKVKKNIDNNKKNEYTSSRKNV